MFDEGETACRKRRACCRGGIVLKQWIAGRKSITERKSITGEKERKRHRILGLFGILLSVCLFLTPALSREAWAGQVMPDTGEENVFQVLFPTNTEDVFDFIMDPQELIAQTHAAAYGNLSFEEGATLFFRRREEAGVDYSSSSDSLVITNLGTADVELVVTAIISSDSLGAIVMTEDGTFMDDQEASLYLALTDGEQMVPIDPETGAVLHAVLPGSGGKDGTAEQGGAGEQAGAEEQSGTGEQSGAGEQKGTGREYRFWLVGAVNRNGDWAEIGAASPKVTVTWSASALEKEEEREVQEPENGEALPENGETLSENGEALPEKGEGLQETPEAERKPEKSGTETPEGERKPEESGTETPEAERKPEESGTGTPDGEKKEGEASGTEKTPGESKAPGKEELPGEPKAPGAEEPKDQPKSPGKEKMPGESKVPEVDEKSGESKALGKEETPGESKAPGVDEKPGESKATGKEGAPG